MIFISTGNAARSPMAEAILRRFGKGRFEVVSAGVCPLAKVGIDATGVESEVTGRIHRFIPAAGAEAA